MSPISWAVLENIALFILVGFLCWFFNSGWAVLLLLTLNTFNIKEMK
ncbi:hypothetical protein UFOVP58_169 [uncultured Caudovirales phage]|uniref:Uncharacterized protein n=1 Tax=uncultured Caudovirales phage TaxID=2100421 RepID=A0A6J5KZM2_9CAUD|nr:hypothetical protein UFOVP58_169 [uncultured Caudovirales phage]